MSKQYHIHLKGYVGGYDFDANYVDYILSKNTDQAVDVLIDSLGGSVHTALSISSAFARHGRVNVHFSGMNASAATVASLGAASIAINRSAMYLVHQCSQTIFVWESMNADELEAHIETLRQRQHDLQKIDENISSMYARRCKKERSALVELMKKGGWLSAEEALEWGFVDEIVDDSGKKTTLTHNMVAAMNNAGIPIPRLPIVEDKTFFDRLTQFFSNFSNNSQKNMSKVFTMLASLLAVESFAIDNGNVSLSESQMQSIEDALAQNAQDLEDRNNQIAQRDTQINDLNTQIADLNDQVAALKALPGASTSTVVDDNNGNATIHDSFVQSCKEASELFDQIP